MQSLKRLFYVWTAMILSASYAFGQTGSIQALVFDSENGQPLIGANVVIAGTTIGNVTDLDGKAAIRGIQSGVYDLQISYVSYQTRLITEVTVEAGKVNSLDIGLSTESVGLDEIVITAEAERSSESALLTVQKKSANLLDAISSDMFSVQGDNDAADAVKRVVGVTVESGKYIYVRGLGDRYSKAVLNGTEIPGLDPNKNSVQMDLFPSHLIDNIIVYKTFSPDLPGDFSGGLVDISMKDFPERFTMQLSASAGLNSQASYNPGFLSHQGGSTDWLGMDDGSRKLPGLINSYTADNYPSPTMGVGTPQEIENFTQAFKNRDFTPELTTAPLNQSLSLSIGNQAPLGSMSLGVIGGLTYSRNFDHYGDGQVNRWSTISSSLEKLVENQQVKYNDTRSTQEVLWGGLLNTTLKINNSNKVRLNLMHNQSGTSETRLLEGPSIGGSQGRINEYGDNDLSFSRVLSWVERGISNAQLEGEHVVQPLNRMKIEWVGSYTMSTMDQPDLKYLRDYYDLASGDFLMTNKDRPGRYFRNMNEDNYDARLNITVPARIFTENETKLKFGGVYTYKTRAFREKAYNYIIPFRSYDGDVDGIFTDERLALDAEGALTGSTLEIITLQNNNYDGEQTIVAGYGMIDAPLTNALRLSGGVRVEQTNQTTKPFELPGAAGNGKNNEGTIEETSLLPAVNLTYSLAENTNLRFSYSQTIARPTFREFAPFSSFGFYGDNIINGNANLTQTDITNYDLRFETYPRTGEYLGISAFYKKLSNPIELTFVLSSAASENTRELTYNNVPEGMISGVELEFRKNLDFITPRLSNFKVNANLSYIHSRVNISEDEFKIRKRYRENASDTRPMFGQSPYVVNASLMYEGVRNGLSSSIGFNVFGERLHLISPDYLDVYEQPRPELNFSIQKRFNNLSIRARVNNVLDPDYEKTIEFRGDQYTYDRFSKGRSFSLSLTYFVEK